MAPIRRGRRADPSVFQRGYAVPDALSILKLADVRTYLSLSHFHRGADLLIMPSAAVLAEMVVSAVTGLAEDDESVEQEAYEDLDANAIANVAGASRPLSGALSSCTAPRARWKTRTPPSGSVGCH